MKKVRIGIVHPKTLVCDGLELLLETKGNCIVSFVVNNQIDLMNNLRLKKSEVLIFDRQLVDNQLQLIPAIKNKYPTLRIILLAETCTIAESEVLKLQNADGIILKSSVFDEYCKAINSLVNGAGWYMDAALQNIHKVELEELEKYKFYKSVDLTDRELEILILICQQLMNKEIADKLFIGEDTVEKHRKNLMEKTNSKTPAGLVLYAVTMGLIPLVNKELYK